MSDQGDEELRRGARPRKRWKVASLVAIGAAVIAGAVAVAVAIPPGVLPADRPDIGPVMPGTPGSGEIAFGTIDGKTWVMLAFEPATRGADGPGQQCFMPIGEAISPFGYGSTSCGPTATDNTLPADISSGAGGFIQPGGHAVVSYGTVRDDVRYVMVQLANGQQLKLDPVLLWGKRYVAFAWTELTAVIRVTAYLHNRQTMTSIPLSTQYGLLQLGQWHRG